MDSSKLSATSRALPPDRPRRFSSLASRLVTLGVLQVLLLAATAVGIFFAQGPRHEGRPHDVIDRAVIAKLEGLVDQPVALQAALDELETDRIEVSLYDGERQLVASSVDPPLAIPPRRAERALADGKRLPDEAPPPGHDAGPPALDGSTPPDAARLGPPPEPPGPRGPRAMVRAFDVHGERGLLVARGIHRKPSFLTGPLLTLICGFVIVVLGALLTARWIVRPIERLSRTAHAIGGGDLRARCRLERSDEIGELGHRVDEMADRIESLLITEKELLANVAHELRTPLSRIGVALDLAGEGDADAARASLGEIAVDVSELETIVDDILTAMRFEVASGAKLPLRRTIVSPAEIAGAAATRLRTRHPTRPLEVTIADALPPIDVDPMMVRRVIDNLLENSHKYSPDPTAALVLDVRSEAAHVIFEVRDHGIGITANDLPHVFTAFFRGDRSRSRESGGVGLGLTLAKRIIEAHAGTIEVSSEHGSGTTVRVSIPLAA